MRPIEPAREPAGDLLTRLDLLPYPRRMRELALLARRLAGTSELTALLGELSARDRYGRRTALHLAMAARDLGFVAESLAGPHMDLRRAALRAVRTLPVPDEAVTPVLRDAPTELRLALYRTLLHGRRRELAESLLPEVQTRWGDREAAALLPACGASTVSNRLPSLAHAVTSWNALAKRHPREVLEGAERELPAGGDAWNWWRRRGAGVEIAALAEPVRALALLERHAPRRYVARLPAAVMSALCRADVVRATRLLVPASSRDWAGPPKTLLDHLRSVPDAEILTTATTDPHRLGAMLRSLPPGRRAAIFLAAAERKGDAAHLWAMPLLEWLPADLAAAEARRMLDRHASVWHSPRRHLDDPGIPLELISYLPYEEAAGPLREAAVGGDPRRRGLARTLLVRCTARTGDRAALLELLSDLARRTTGEQDPLRRGLLKAMGEIPPSLLDDSYAETLGRVATDAAEAPDSAAVTREALCHLAGRVLRHHPPATAPALTAWALQTYGKLVARHGAGGLPAPVPVPAHRPGPAGRRRGVRAPEPHRFDQVLRRGQERDLLGVLRPHLRAARDRDDFTLAVALAEALGRRAWALGELQDDLRAAVRAAPEPLARRAAGLWLARAADREGRAAELAGADTSAVRLPPVCRTVAGRRTDLLLPLLAGADRGRFADGPWVPPISGGVAGRWTPAQHGRVREVLAAAADDRRLPVAVRVAAVQATGRIGGGLELLSAWARLAETVPAEAAITAMSGTDEPGRALPVLLEHSRGRASRVAVAGLARCCRAVVPSLLGPILGRALEDAGGKVTLRKQAARLLARDRPPGAADLLLRAWADTGLHPDVRVAVAVALRRLPEDPRALDALGDAAGPYAGELMMRTLFQAGPLEYAPDVRPGYANLVRRLLEAAADPGVRFRGSKAFASWAHWYRGGFDEIVAAAGRPGAAGEAVMPVFLALLRAGVIRVQALDVLARLAAAVPAGGVSPEAPARARMAAVTDALATAWNPGTPPWRRRLARDAAALLAARPLLLPEAVRLAVAALPVLPAASREPADRELGDGELGDGELADGLCALADLLRDRPVLAARTAGEPLSIRFREHRAGRAAAPEVLLPAVRRLAGRADLAAGLLAVTLTRIAGFETGWAAPWQETLRELRDSPHLEVRQEAWDTAVH